jgi:hypothetical protein
MKKFHCRSEGDKEFQLKSKLLEPEKAGPDDPASDALSPEFIYETVIVDSWTWPVPYERDRSACALSENIL